MSGNGGWLEKIRKGAPWGLIAVLILSIVLFVYAIYKLVSYGDALNNDNQRAPEIILSILLVLGVTALIIVLAVTAAIFRSLDLSNARQPLGLPQGSIRAVIALVLILIFMMSSVFLYMQVNTSGIEVSKNISQRQIDTIPTEDVAWIRMVNATAGPNGTPLFNVGRKVVPNQASEDLAQQIVTTVSTLVVAVAAFYFGSKSVEEATRSLRGEGSDELTPLIRNVELKDTSTGTPIPRGKDTELTIHGRNLESVDKVLLALGTETIECTNVTKAPTLIRCTVNIPADTPPKTYPGGKWAVVVTDSGGEADRLDGAVDV